MGISQGRMSNYTEQNKSYPYLVYLKKIAVESFLYAPLCYNNYLPGITYVDVGRLKNRKNENRKKINATTIQTFTINESSVCEQFATEENESLRRSRLSRSLSRKNPKRVCLPTVTFWLDDLDNIEDFYLSRLHTSNLDRIEELSHHVKKFNQRSATSFDIVHHKRSKQLRKHFYSKETNTVKYLYELYEMSKRSANKLIDIPKQDHYTKKIQLKESKNNINHSHSLSLISNSSIDRVSLDQQNSFVEKTNNNSLSDIILMTTNSQNFQVQNAMNLSMDNFDLQNDNLVSIEDNDALNGYYTINIKKNFTSLHSLEENDQEIFDKQTFICFDYLLNNVAKRLFNYLPLNDLILLQFLYPHLSLLLQDSCYWAKYLEYLEFNDFFSHDQIAKLLSCTDNEMTRLSIANRQYQNINQIKTYYNSSSSIKSLKLSSSCIIDSTFIQELSRIKSISTLIVDGYSPTFVSDQYSVLSRYLPRLEYLRLVIAERINCKSTQNYLKENKRLLGVHLVGDLKHQHLDALYENENIRTLFLENVRLDKYSFQTLRKFQNLKEFSFINSNLTSRKVAKPYCLEFLEKYSNLTYLQLNGELPMVDIQHLTKALNHLFHRNNHLNQLKTFILQKEYAAALSEKCLERLSIMCPQLTVLSIQCPSEYDCVNTLGKEIWKKFGLKASNLEVLRIEHLQMSPTDCFLDIKSPEMLPNIKYLGLIGYALNKSTINNWKILLDKFDY